MKAGRLRERITFQRRTSALNEYGEGKDVWRPLVTVWAAVEPISGREFFAAQQVLSEITTRVICRYSDALSDVEERDRILTRRLRRGRPPKTAYLDIRSIIDVNSRGRELQFMCTQHVGE